MSKECQLHELYKNQAYLAFKASICGAKGYEHLAGSYRKQRDEVTKEIKELEKQVFTK